MNAEPSKTVAANIQVAFRYQDSFSRLGQLDKEVFVSRKPTSKSDWTLTHHGNYHHVFGKTDLQGLRNKAMQDTTLRSLHFSTLYKTIEVEGEDLGTLNINAMTRSITSKHQQGNSAWYYRESDMATLWIKHSSSGPMVFGDLKRKEIERKSELWMLEPEFFVYEFQVPDDEAYTKTALLLVGVEHSNIRTSWGIEEFMARTLRLGGGATIAHSAEKPVEAPSQGELKRKRGADQQAQNKNKTFGYPTPPHTDNEASDTETAAKKVKRRREDMQPSVETVVE